MSEKDRLEELKDVLREAVDGIRKGSLETVQEFIKPIADSYPPDEDVVSVCCKAIIFSFIDVAMDVAIKMDVPPTNFIMLVQSRMAEKDYLPEIVRQAMAELEKVQEHVDGCDKCQGELKKRFVN